jgi:hypothetical protein
MTECSGQITQFAVGMFIGSLGFLLVSFFAKELYNRWKKK